MPTPTTQDTGMDVQAPNHPYTILRIKRKRTEEPLDALVVESRFRRKKTRGGLDVFQFAQTVEHDAWEDSETRQNLQSQISKLAQDSYPAPVRETKIPPAPHRADTGARRYAVRVTDEGDPKSKRRPTSPPKVISSKDTHRNDFRMYDAVLENQGSSLPPMDSEMEKFLPMLQDYLTLQETSSIITPNASLYYANARSDYVWDVFYRRPYSVAEWNSSATNYGTVTGLPLSVEDEELSDNSESEEEDEADEDSNAEEYYKNDYPDEDDTNTDNDSFYSASEDDDTDGDLLDSDHDWR